MNPERRPVIDKLAFIYLRDQKVLMSRTRGNDTWYIPGGKREPGESDEQALVREVNEELAVDLVPESIKAYGVFKAQAHNKPEGVVVQMTCYTAEFDGEPVASAEIEELTYLPYATGEPLSPVDYLIFDDLHAKGLLA